MQTGLLTDEAQDERLIQIMTLAHDHARRMLASDLAGDVAQDVVLDCLCKMRGGEWTDPMSLPGFVLYMVRRRVVDLHRRSIHRAERDAVHAREVGTSHGWMDPTIVMEEAELEAIQEMAMGRLSVRSRSAFVMVHEEELTYRVAAERLGVAPKTIDNHLRRARARLRELLRESGVEVGS
jgi:RNA polymerase sigma factor (sigma-70 family)